MNFASQQRLVVRRVFYIATGTAALVSIPQILSSIPEREQRDEAFRSASQLLQVSPWLPYSNYEVHATVCHNCALVKPFIHPIKAVHMYEETDQSV